MTAVLLIITWFVLGYIGARAFLDDPPGEYGIAIFLMILGAIAFLIALMGNADFFIPRSLKNYSKGRNLLAKFFRQEH